MESDLWNNTNRSHDFVELLVNLEADRGIKIDGIDTARLSEAGFTVEGATVNGVKTKNGEVLINLQSAKSLNSVLGHEITHVLEGTEAYKVLKDAVVKYAESKGEYDKRLTDITKLYKKAEGADVDAELTADLVGDYLFTDEGFIKSLTEHKNLFQRIFDEIKYFCSIAVKGSNEETKLLKIKRAFEKALASVNEENVQVGEKRYIGLEEFTDRENKIWRNVAYEDNETKAQITKELHSKMVEEGLIVKVSDEISEKVSESYPNLQSMKKKERLPILKKAIEQLKQNLRDFLNGFKGKNFEFEINGEILEAKLYNVGINEVLEKITQEKAQMLYVTEEIFKSAKYLYSTPDYAGDPNVYRWNYFYTPVQIGEDIVGVRIAIRDMATPKESQIYNWGIKKDTSLEGIGRGTNDRISYGISSDVSNNSISQPAEKSTENLKNVENGEDYSLSGAADGDLAPMGRYDVRGDDVAYVGDDLAPLKPEYSSGGAQYSLSEGAVLDDDLPLSEKYKEERERSSLAPLKSTAFLPLY